MPTKPKAAPDPRLSWVGLAILYGVWGSTYLAIAVGVQTIPPFLMAAARFGLAGLILLTWVALRDRKTLARPTRRERPDPGPAARTVRTTGWSCAAPPRTG